MIIQSTSSVSPELLHWLACSRVQPGSPFGLPAPYPPPGAFTRPLPDSWELPDSYRSKNQLKITFLGLKDRNSYHNESNWKFSQLLTVVLPMKIHCKNICMIEQWLFNFRNSYHKPLNTLKKKNIHINQNDFIPEVTVVRFCFQQWCIKQSLICLCHLSM